MNQNYEWYAQLAKPFFAPPAWLFGPVWTVLYVIIAVTFARAFYLAFKKNIPAAMTIPFILNLIVNLSYTPIEFGLKNNLYASIDVLAVLGTLIWAMIAIKPYSRAISRWQMPYLAWVSFATILQLTITYLNW